MVVNARVVVEAKACSLEGVSGHSGFDSVEWFYLVYYTCWDAFSNYNDRNLH